MSSKLRVRIFPDGQIKAEVIGVKGKACVDYIELLEQLLDAETTESEFTTEYYETEQLTLEQHHIQQNMNQERRV